MKFIFSILMLASLLLCSTAYAFVSLPPGSKPVPVKVGLRIDDVSAFDEAHSTLQFEAEMHVQWQDARLSYDASKEKTTVKQYINDAAKKMLDTIWQPHLRLLNSRGRHFVTLRRLDVAPDGRVTYVEMFHAKVETPLDLRIFPFDTQDLFVRILSFSYGDQDVKLIPWKEYNMVAPQGALELWKINGFEQTVRPYYDAQLDKTYSVFNFRMHFQRQPWHYLYQMFLPLLMIVFLSFSVFWLKNSPLSGRVSIGLSCSMILFVFQWRIENDLPRIAYNTLVDHFVYFSFLIVALTTLSSVIMVRTGNRPRIIRFFRFAFPLLYLWGLVMFYFVYL